MFIFIKNIFSVVSDRGGWRKVKKSGKRPEKGKGKGR